MDCAYQASDAVAEKIVSLADDYARQIVALLPDRLPPRQELPEGISGALLSASSLTLRVRDE